MPIEVFEGKTGPRVIARMPVSDGSFVEITYTNPQGTYRFRASYQNGRANGYPALSPMLGSLDRKIAESIESERNMLIYNATMYLNNARFPLPRYEQTQAQATADIYRYKNAVPILSAVKQGQDLAIVLPDYFPTTRYLLGRVVRWHIVNS